MKKLILQSVFLFLGIVSFGQNGFTAYPNTISQYHSKTSIAVDASGNKWYGTTANGAYKFDGASWTVYNISNSSIPSNYINDIAFDALGNAWFATRAGLAKFDGTIWTTYNTSNSGLINDTINCVITESANVWIGTNGGLSKFNGNNVWTSFTTANSGITNNKVTALNIDINGDILVGTLTGFCIKTASSWIKYTANNSYLVDSQIGDIYVENASTKWISTGPGILFRLKNNVAVPLTSLFSNKKLYIPFVFTISKGPQGGVLISGSLESTGPASAGFLEILGSEIYYYPFPQGSNYYSTFHVFDSNNNKVWFVNKYVSNNNLYSFDFSNFSGTIIIPDDSSETNLDVNQVRARILNRGDMHWDFTGSAGYEVPKNSGRNAIFASSLWIGGLDAGNNLHEAAMTYRQTGNDYWPGPLDTLTGNTDSATSFAYDKIWKLDKWQIEEFRTMFANGSVTAGTYTPAANIINWPAHGTGYYTRNLAPFVDVNGDGIYNPLTDGDYPKIKGDQMCYWIFNDNLKAHTETGGLPLKVEVHASAYAYSCDSINDSLKALNFTTFYDYEIFNRSTSNYHNVYLSFWEDFDAGGYSDDYAGCNVTENYSFVYNSDSIDENVSNVLGYGNNPPMYSNVILNGPLAVPADGIDNNNDGTIDEIGEKNLMTNVLNYDNAQHPIIGNPNTAMDFYNYMQSIWQDNSHLIYGGNGMGPGSPYNFMYDGVPTLPGWSEATLQNPSRDHRINMSCGPFNLYSASHVNFNFAIVYTRDDQPTYDILHLYNKNLSDVKKIKQWYAADNFPSCDHVSSVGINETLANANNLLLYPNPSSDIVYMDYKTTSKNAMITIYDVKGQLIKQMKLESQSKQAINISSFTSGLYLMVVSDGKNIDTERFIKQ